VAQRGNPSQGRISADADLFFPCPPPLMEVSSVEVEDPIHLQTSQESDGALLWKDWTHLQTSQDTSVLYTGLHSTVFRSRLKVSVGKVSHVQYTLRSLTLCRCTTYFHETERFTESIKGFVVKVDSELVQPRFSSLTLPVDESYTSVTSNQQVHLKHRWPTWR